MNIQPRYNEYRIGATIIEPIKAANNDLSLYVNTVRNGDDTWKSWQMTMDCRALAGKLLNCEKTANLLYMNKDDFVFVLVLHGVKAEQKLFVGGHETYSFVVYDRKMPNDMLKKVDEWLKRFLADVSPKEHTFSYGRGHKYGLLPNSYGALSYVIITNDGYGHFDKKFGQPFTEKTWGIYE